jgi:hypothetical protein
MRVGVALFGVGMLAVLVVFFLFATGLRDLPVWLSGAAGILTPLGLGLGLLSLIREIRDRKTSPATTSDATSDAEPDQTPKDETTR